MKVQAKPDVISIPDEAVPYNQRYFYPFGKSCALKALTCCFKGLHGGVVDGEVNVAQHVDFLIGMVPIVNLEWIQKSARHPRQRTFTRAVMTNCSLNDDYLNYITPQFFAPY